jgi:hypothetical protein
MPDKAIGNWRANNPLWSGISYEMWQLETGYTLAVEPTSQKTDCLQTKWSPYTVSRTIILSSVSDGCCAMVNW